MRDGDTGGYIGHHTPDSLFASADEMAGHNNNTYSPQTNIVRQNEGDASVTHRDPLVDIEEMELHYPMPDAEELWRQADHPESLTKTMYSEDAAAQEAFGGAAKIFSCANPDTFVMPLEARQICMKLDRLVDMKYCIANGAVTNVAKCNQRIMETWANRDGERVFMMFSVSGQREFCAMAEMTGPVRRGSLPGWSKPGCVGIIPITLIYIKNVPFSLINHIKHKANKQPVANMWNSMTYNDNTGYHVAKIYVEHPVLSSMLVTSRLDKEIDYKSRLRIATTGNTSYSASSYGSHNDKSHDPRSATRVTIHRSGNRNQWSGASRDAMQGQLWRRDGIAPTPQRQLQFDRSIAAAMDSNTTATMDSSIAAAMNAMNITPTAHTPQHYGRPQSNMAAAAAPPPSFPLGEHPHPASRGVSNSSGTAPSFTTADDRMLAEYASSRATKRNEATPPTQNIGGLNNAPGGFREARASRTGQHSETLAPAPLVTELRGESLGFRDSYQGSPHNVQWQKNGRAAQVPIYFDSSVDNTMNGGYRPQTQVPAQTGGHPTHLPTPAASTQPSKTGPSVDGEALRKQLSQGFKTPSQMLIHNEVTQSYGRQVPQTSGRLMYGIDNSSDGQDDVAKPGSPMKHSQSMPMMLHQPLHRLSAKHLNAHATSFRPQGVRALGPRESPDVEMWVSGTPTRPAFQLKSSPILSTVLTDSSGIEDDNSPEKDYETTRILDKEQQIKWHNARISMLEAEIALSRRANNAEKRHLLKWHKGNIERVECEIIAAHKQHEQARGELAQPTIDHPPSSPGTPENSTHWPKKAATSSIESALIESVTDDNGKIVRSISKNREGKATHISQKPSQKTLRHARGHVRNGSFTGSFDARMNANVNELLASPTDSNMFAGDHPFHTHGHPPQRSVSRRDHKQYDSGNEEQYFASDGYQDDAESYVGSQFGADKDENDVFSPRGRGYYSSPSESARDPSQVSYHGGINLNKAEYGYK